MQVQEVAALPRKPAPAHPTERTIRFSARKFAEAWDRKKKDPTFRTLHLLSAAGVDAPNTLTNWRKGKTEPSASQAMAIAAVLGLGPLDLFE